MKRSWFIWLFVGGVVVTILLALNYEGNRKVTPLSEIFPDEATPVEPEYEFIEADEKLATMVESIKSKDAASVPAPQQAAVPVAPKTSTPSHVPPKQGVVVPAVSASKVKAVVPPPPPVGSTTAAKSEGGTVFTIQIASFKDKGKAESALDHAQKKGYSAYLNSQTRPNGDIWYRVYVGKFNAQDEAKILLGKIKQDYQDGFIKILQNH